MGFGHRVYKNYDPRAKIIKKACDDVFEVTGVNPLLKIAQELEKIALEDEYFVKRKLYPNVDFYSGLIYEALQFPPEMFTVLFAIGRTPGWLAQWSELVQDKEQKIARPKQIYTGIRTRDFVPISRAVAAPTCVRMCSTTGQSVTQRLDTAQICARRVRAASRTAPPPERDHRVRPRGEEAARDVPGAGAALLAGPGFG